jgi:hypothetical protein
MSATHVDPIPFEVCVEAAADAGGGTHEDKLPASTAVAAATTSKFQRMPAQRTGVDPKVQRNADDEDATATLRASGSNGAAHGRLAWAAQLRLSR